MRFLGDARAEGVKGPGVERAEESKGYWNINGRLIVCVCVQCGWMCMFRIKVFDNDRAKHSKESALRV